MRKTISFVTLLTIILFTSLLHSAEVVQTITVGKGPHRSVVIPDGTKAYVVNRDSDELTVLDLREFPHTILKYIPVGDSPSDIALAPNGEKVYVTNRQAGTISVINTQHDILIETIGGIGLLPSLLEITPNGEYIYISNNHFSDLRVVRINLNTMSIETFLYAAPFVPQTIYFSPDSKIGFFGMVSTQNTNLFTEIRDLETGTLLKTIFDFNPAAISKNGKVLFMVNQFLSNPKVTALDIENLSSIETLWTATASPRPNAFFVFNKNETELIMANDFSNIVTILDAKTGSFIQSIQVGIWPCGISISPNYKYVYVGNLLSNTVSVIQLDQPQPFEVVLDINPDTLNLKSKGKWVTCYVEFPKEYDLNDVDISTLAVVKIDDTILDEPVYAEMRPTNIGDYDNDGVLDLMIKFSRSSLIQILEVEDCKITISGSLTDGTEFFGRDTIRIINQGGKK